MVLLRDLLSRSMYNDVFNAPLTEEPMAVIYAGDLGVTDTSRMLVEKF